MKEHEAKLKLEREGPPRRKCDVRGVQIIFDVWDEDGDDWWQKADLQAFAQATKSFGCEGELSQEQYEDLIAQMGADADEGIDSETLAL